MQNCRANLMKNESYKRVIVVSAKPREAYRALTKEFALTKKFNESWSLSSNDISAEGDFVTFRFEPTFWIFRVTRLAPEKLIELKCIDANDVHEGLPETIREEWVGTKIRWKIEPHGNGSQISFVHEGLIPTLGCYEICEAGWDHFFVKSLKAYLDKDADIPRSLKGEQRNVSSPHN